ncbi:hypothetical protein GUITHDRAFT_165093 [Guillardia theta CCMP2712]|uniref:Uncharacterized protein n=1 Tax=Guillardia theta (strain CCMP2712) TaxID=905079 RepID=L1ISR3_GUITC|nr:hypothetical protein GUITHDRAFT_165093 [Guillardia theta CCMP2712]EKX38870.1 hypothetical protein GUITHDRAFT_165093 [Guillardia theta CCMP2712]|eukprot:XP_005825850.1 hypothetical protein GUITHDRAFT_165093 [Guillardia theta CCMP2712]
MDAHCGIAQTSFLFLLLSVFPSCVPQQVYKTCLKQSDCTDPSFPICKIFWSNAGVSSIQNSLQQYDAKGVVSSALATANARFLSTSDAYNVQLLSQAYEGLKIRSICKPIDTSTRGTCSALSYLQSDHITSVAQGGPSGRNAIVLDSHGYLSRSESNRFCGAVSSYAGQYLGCVGDLCNSINSLTNPLQGTAAVCRKIINSTRFTAFMPSNSLCATSITGLTSNGCSQLDQQCGAVGYSSCGSNGVAQICMNGKWVKFVPSTGYDWSYANIHNNVYSQTLISISCFCALSFIFMCLKSGVRMVRPSGKVSSNVESLQEAWNLST